MLLTSCADREHTLDKAAPAIALRAVTPLAPEHGRTQRPFRRVVGWLNALHLNECSEGIPQADQFTRQAAQIVTAVLGDMYAFPHRVLNGCQHRLQHLPVDRSGPVAFPHREHEFGKRQQIGGIGLPAPFGLDSTAQIADQMRPTHLTARERKAVAGRQPIQRHVPGKGRIHERV